MIESIFGAVMVAFLIAWFLVVLVLVYHATACLPYWLKGMKGFNAHCPYCLVKQRMNKPNSSKPGAPPVARARENVPT